MANRSWDIYPATYRAEEVKILAEWIRRGNSGAVIGVAGTGKSNLLGFLCHRPEVIHAHWQHNATPTPPVVLIALDLDDLPADDLATLYRVILRSFYENSASLTAWCKQGEGKEALPLEGQASFAGGAQLSTLQEEITQLYEETRRALDPFLCQSAVHSLLRSFREQSVRVVLVMDRFEEFCEVASPQMLSALRALRNKFKDILSYLIGMCREVDYLAQSDKEIHSIVSSYVLRVGVMNEEDARKLIDQEMYLVAEPPDEDEEEQLLALSGRHAGLLQAACHWWLTTPDEGRTSKDWADMLLIESSIQSRLSEIWQGLTQKEQAALSEVQHLQNNPKNSWTKLIQRYDHLLEQLEAKGLCERQEIGWHIFNPLLNGFFAQKSGIIWINEKKEQFYQGQRVIKGLPPKEWNLLHFFVKNPHMRHSKTEIIINVWSEKERLNGISDESLYRVIRVVRKLIEPISSNPSYIISRQARGLEGGYQFFPEGDG
jgi:hypothetical protein